MIDTIKRSRNARLNQARKAAAQIRIALDPERRPKDGDADGWNALFAEARDAAQDILQFVCEASAYNNAFNTVKQEEADYD